MEAKHNKDIRKQFKIMRDALSDEDRAKYSDCVCKNFLALLESDFKGANIFLCFYPLGTEVDLLPLYDLLLDSDKSLFFPVSDITNKKLNFYRINDLSKDFHLGAFNVMEPDDTLELFANNDSQVIAITPGLVFDENCDRIGYGAGFYDRFFAQNSNLIKIGACYDMQVLPEIEPKAFDVPLDYIVTDGRIIKRGK